MLRMQGAKTNCAKSQSQKATCRSETGNAKEVKSQSRKSPMNPQRQTERKCECRGCKMKSHKSYKNPRKSHKSQKSRKPPTLKNKKNLQKN